MRAGCVICGDIFVATEDISATSCGHTFHSVCIFEWIERSKSCPTCRQKTTQKSLVKLYFDGGGTDATEVDPDSLQQVIDNQKFQIRLKQQEINKLKETASTLTTQNKNLRAEVKSVEQQVRAKESTLQAIKTQLQFMDRISTEAQKAKEDVKSLREHLKLLQNVEVVVSGRNDDVQMMLNSYSDSPGSLRSVSTLCSVLKKELSKAREDKNRLRGDSDMFKKLAKEARKAREQEVAKLVQIEQANVNLKDDICSLERENSSLKKKLDALQSAIVSPSGDVKNSALHRLIAESPVPAHLKRPHHRMSDEDDAMVTPEVVRKILRSEDKSEAINDGPLCIDLSSPDSSKLFRQPLSDTINLGSQPSSHINIFAKTKHYNPKELGSSSKSSMSNEKSSVGKDVGYDGLGGHHRVDIFPKPLHITIKKNSKKGVRITTKNGASKRVQSATIKNFFSNTFDDS